MVLRKLIIAGLLVTATAHAGRYEALEAEIESEKKLLLEQMAELRDLEARGDTAGADALRRRIEAGKQALVPKVAELAELRHRQNEAGAAAAEQTKTAVPPSPSVPLVERHGLLESRSGVTDAEPYERSIQGRVAMFRVVDHPKWLVLDDRRVVVWVLEDEAYLLELVEQCPALIGAGQVRVESFSTRVRMGKEAVRIGDQRCVIGSIARLGGRSLPKPPTR